MADPEKDWKAMILIGHDFFHRWRQAVEERYGREEADALGLRVWELVAEGTAHMYRKAQLDPNDLAGIVQGIARSSEIMGEKVRVEQDGDDIILVHDACPWVKSYSLYGAAGRCQAGCDRWFATTLAAFAPHYKVFTECALPSGAGTCKRRFSRRAD